MKGNQTSGSFNKASGKSKPKRHKNYTHRELIQKLDTYEKVIKEPKGKAQIDATKRLYKADQRRKSDNRGKRNVLFLEGKKRGLHYGKTVEGLEKDREAEDNKTRREVAKKGRAIYQRNYTLSKQFKAKAKAKAKGKEKTK